MTDIPSTIPSNQLKVFLPIFLPFLNFNLPNQNPVIEQSNNASQLSTQDSLCMSQFRKSLDELENLSFNLDTAGNNTANNTINEPVSTQQNEEIFDELAMLCSGQFRADSQKKENKKDMYQFEDDDDDDDDDLDEEEKIIKKFRKQEEIESEKDDDDDQNEDDLISDEDQEVDEEIEIRDEETRPKSREQKLKIKKKLKEEYKKALEKDGFFEEEAELSGDEKDEDDDYDGDSADDSIVCSGDEDNLPSDSELKDQLGRIYHKDKMDEEKRQLRLIKEMYLSEKDEKNSRRKNFRWKHIDDNLGVGFNSDSSQEEDEDGGEDDKKNNFFKSVANGDWRSNRHEREQFVKQNIRKENLLSDDDEEEKDEEEDESCLRIFGSSANQPGNQLLKKGQMLLKKKAFVMKPSLAQKRAFDDDKGNQSRIVVQKRVEAKKSDQKFSFLGRDKSYLSRISNYTVRPNNMVFSVIEPQNKMNDENKNIQIKNTNKQTSTDSSNLEPKRAKYDYSHILSC
ncbi:claspin [Brachionus plicatilis]|uniref:Claspin n=1 Tax=Brachionus plicatilis TaxID=10195 RepID=A0A3M7QF01_BRAPC|nr:claspin [Brachionus plicatilis]